MNTSQYLQDAMAQLYTVFADYTVDTSDLRAYSCECCVSDAEIREITTSPLQTLSEDQLRHFSASAISTFGEVRHYKHYLPRILELMSKDESEFADEFICFEKLKYGSWDTWADKEQKAIHKYFVLLWEQTINNPQVTEHRLNAIFIIMFEYGYFKRALTTWEASETDVSTMYLVNGILRNFSFSASEIIKNQFLDWLRTPAILAKIETQFYKTEDTIEANEISIAYTILEKNKTIFIR